MTTEKKLGIALGGGGPRGIAHIGVLTAFEEVGIQPNFLTGTSVGSLVAALYAFGVKLEEQKNLALNMRWHKIAKIKLPRYGLVTNQNLKIILEKILGKNKKIEKANLPLAIIATNIETGDKIILKKGDLASAIMASSSVPGIFTPVTIDGQMLVDGGLVENIPISPLKQMGADVIVAIDLMRRPLPRKPKNISEIMSNSIYIMLEQIKKINKLEADIVLEPKLPTYIKTDTSSLQKMYKEGYQVGKSQVNKILKLLSK